MKQSPAPVVITLCGSTRFKDHFMAMQQRETLLGKIVLTVGFFHHKEQVPITAKDKVMLDNLHLRKIDLSDEIFVINPNGYVGESTTNEIAYAVARHKYIKWFEDGEAWMEDNSHKLGKLVAHFMQYDTVPEG